MNKKDDLPYFPFYIGDWLKATDVRALPLETRAIWFEMLCCMWESTERGYLTVNGKPIPDESLARMIGIPEILLKQNVKVLMDFGVPGIREVDGAIYSRRMVKDQDIREKRQKAGSLGGKHSFASRFAQANIQANADIEVDIENRNKDIKDTGGKVDLEQHLLSHWGREGRQGAGVMKKFVDAIGRFGRNEVLDAIEIAGQQNKKSYAYVLGILEKRGTKKKEIISPLALSRQKNEIIS